LRAGGNQDFQMTKTSLEQAQHNIRNLILTYPGERVNQPEFGCRLRDLLFEQLDGELPTRIDEEVRRSISQWLPYVNVVQVETLTDEGDTNRVFVQVKYTTTLNPQEIILLSLQNNIFQTHTMTLMSHHLV
jgi:phage baseplate assembly protein W